MKFLIYFLCLLSTLTVCFASDKIKLTDLRTLTLYSNHKTNGRRSPGVQQLECIGGSAHCDKKYTPTVVQCSNAGSDGYDVQWTCKAELETNVKFGTIDVSCEGYDYPNDPYVLKGSCGLRYSLDRKSSGGSKTYQKETSTTDSYSNIMIIIFIVAIIIAIVWWNSSSTNTDTPTVDPTCPPPPGFRSEYTSPPNNGAPPPYSSVFNENKYTRGATSNDGPGFWTGLGAGGLMGYMFGSGNNTRRRTYDPTATYTESRYTHGEDRTPRPRSTTPEFRTATGYGGTSRR